MRAVLAISIQLCVFQVAPAGPRVAATERYQREILRLMIAEANQIASELSLDEHLPITRTNLARVFLLPAGKTFGFAGVLDTASYSYSMDVKDFGIVVSSVTRSGYDDFHEARAKYSWPMSRYDSNRVLNVAAELMHKGQMDWSGLNRDCRIRIDFPEETPLLVGTFSPIYTVSWFEKTNTFAMSAGRLVALIEFIEPSKRARRISLSGALGSSKYNLRKPREKMDFMALLAPENSREAILNEMEMATNLVKRFEDLRQGGLPESDLRQLWLEYTNVAFPTNLLGVPKTNKGPSATR